MDQAAPDHDPAGRFDPFEGPLLRGRLVQRYKRFLADIELEDGTAVTAHCPNSGSMLGLKEPGWPVMVRHVDDPKRKLKWTWELVSPDDGATWVGINTHRPNRVVAHYLHAGVLPGLDPDQGVRREVKYGKNSRIDLLLGDPDAPDGGPATYIEVKNTTLAYRTGTHEVAVGGDAEGGRRAGDRRGAGPHTAVFPDAVTARGMKHMQELQAMVEAGHEAVVVPLVNRADCDRFGLARDIDPGYAEAFDHAVAAGVRVLPLGVGVDAGGWWLRGELPMA